MGTSSSILHLLEQSYRGLKHGNGSVLQYSWRDLQQGDGLRHLLQLVAHESSSQWNVPAGCAPGALVSYAYSSPVTTSESVVRRRNHELSRPVSAPSGAPGQGR